MIFISNSSVVRAFLVVGVLSLIAVFSTTAAAQEDQFGVTINRRPLRDFSKRFQEAIDGGKIDWNSPVKVTVTGELVASAPASYVKLTKVMLVSPASRSNNAKHDFVVDAILAFGDSGWFGYVAKFGASKVIIQIEQTNDTVAGRLTSALKDDETAKSTVSAINALLSIGKPVAKPKEKKLLDAMSVSQDGKNLVLSFSMPSFDLIAIIKNELEVKAN